MPKTECFHSNAGIGEAYGIFSRLHTMNVTEACRTAELDHSNVESPIPESLPMRKHTLFMSV